MNPQSQLATDVPVAPTRPNLYRLIEMRVDFALGGNPWAWVKFGCPDGQDRASAHTGGDGTIDALFQALNTAIGSPVQLMESTIFPPTNCRTTEKPWLVKLNLIVDGHEANGTGQALDINEAFTQAYLDALNTNFLAQDPSVY